MQWLKERPSRSDYYQEHREFLDSGQCDYCGANRLLPSLEMVLPNNLRFGLIANSFDGYLHFKSYICSRCGSHLFRESYVE